MRSLVFRLLRETRGVSALEFALIAPVLIALAIGTIEFGRLIMLSFKLQNGSFILADLAARDRTLSEGQLANIFLAIDKVIEPFEFAASGTAIVTSVTGNAVDTPIINWQREGSGALPETSAIGAPGEEADLPATLTLTSGETVIVAEVFYAFEPIFGLTAEPRTLYRVAYFKPRLGTLDTLLP